MNTEESRLLQALLDQLTAIRGVAKDPEADQRIQQAAAAQPDAVYLLVQKTLLQEQALNLAKGEISRLQQQLSQANASRTAPAAGGFLGQDPWSAPASAPAQRGGYAPAPGAAAPGYPPPGTAAGANPFGSFLGSVAATAAGVAGGAFLFHGLESLMGHHGAGQGFADAAFDPAHQVPENVTINQFYGDDQPEHPDAATAHYGEYTPTAGEDEQWSADDDDFTGMDV